MSTNRVPGHGPEHPRSEPEIIPPGGDDGLRRGPGGLWMRFEERDGIHRVFIARPGLPAIILALLAIGLVVAVVFLLLAGLVLLWIPVVVGGILLALLSGAARRHWRRFQAWLAGNGR